MVEMDGAGCLSSRCLALSRLSASRLNIDATRMSLDSGPLIPSLISVSNVCSVCAALICSWLDL